MPFSRTRTGCYTCREEGYKCDEQKPFCGRCVRLDKTCKGYGVKLRWQTPELPQSKEPRRRRQQRRLSPGSHGTSTVTPSAASSPAVSPSPTSPMTQMALTPVAPVSIGSNMDPEHRYLLDHWTTTLGGVISMATGTHQNPFLLHLTPMMAHSTSLRFALCSIAACHLAALKNDQSLQTTATRHRLRAVSSLRQSIQTDDPELSLATVLMLQLSDRLFTTDSGVDHLAGANAIIKRGGANAWNSSSASFLLSLCCYHDILTSVSRGTRPILELKSQVPIEGAMSLQELTSVLQVVAQISRLQGQDHLDAQGRAIEQTLQTFDASIHSGGESGHTLQAYKHASFIYLYRVWQAGAPHPSAMNDHARSCLQHLSEVPVSSPLVSAHVWPLWTAGCETIGGEQRQLVGERIEAMWEARHLPSLRRIKQDMEEVWLIKDKQRNLIGEDNVDCIKAILTHRRRAADLA